MLFQEQLIYLVNHLYPKSIYPTDRKDWTIGHKCMAYFDKRVPKENILMPSWLALTFQRWVKDGKPLGNEVDDFITIINIASDRLNQLRLDITGTKNMAALIKKHGVANCQEFSDMAKQWLDKQGVPCQEIVSMIFDQNQHKFGGHVFVLFHTKTPELCADFNTAVQHFADPDMQILDLWLGQCAPAVKMMNTYLNLFINPVDLHDFTYAQKGDLVLWQEGLYPFNEAFAKPEKTQQCCVIGTVTQIGGKNKLDMPPHPIRVCRAKQKGVDFVARKHIR